MTANRLTVLTPLGKHDVLVRDGDTVRIDDKGKVTANAPLPAELGSLVTFQREGGYPSPNRRIAAVRTGSNGWQVTGRGDFVSDYDLLGIILDNGGVFDVIEKG